MIEKAHFGDRESTLCDYFYFDESVHERAGFILGAFVYSEEPLDLLVAAALEDVGLQPGIDEFRAAQGPMGIRSTRGFGAAGLPVVDVAAAGDGAISGR